jgi:hypothetical protein
MEVLEPVFTSKNLELVTRAGSANNKINYWKVKMLKNNGFHNRHSPLPFSPSSLFANGEQGWWYDPSNFSTLFQDAAGTTPVTAVEQPVGLQLDLSGRGNHRFQTTSANRPVVSARVNLFVGTATLSTQSVTTRATTHTLTFTGAGSITLLGTAVGVYTAGTYSVTTTAGTLTATVLGTVTQADLREMSVGVGLPAYQAVVTSINYDTVGFPIYIKPNGSNQFMVTNSINFTATDKMTVWQGVRKLSDTAAAVLTELSTNSGSNGGSFAVFTPAAVAPSYGFRSIGTVQQIASSALLYPAPITNVVTGIGNISGDISTIRINGSSTSNTGDQGTGNYGAYPAYFYMRGGASLPFSGHDYGSIVRGAASTAAQITAGETYINSKTKAYI